MTSQIEQIQEILKKLIQLMGFKDFSVSYYEDSRRFSVFINDAPFLKNYLEQVINDFNFIFKNILKKQDKDIIFIDINNYRKEREDIIIKLAKAAAKKCVATKQNIDLPPMNSFERRIIHTELSMNPDVRTESEGEGKNRHVVVKFLS